MRIPIAKQTPSFDNETARLYAEKEPYALAMSRPLARGEHA
jgi:hypothetical protein